MHITSWLDQNLFNGVLKQLSDGASTTKIPQYYCGTTQHHPEMNNAVQKSKRLSGK